MTIILVKSKNNIVVKRLIMNIPLTGVPCLRFGEIFLYWHIDR